MDYLCYMCQFLRLELRVSMFSLVFNSTNSPIIIFIGIGK